MPRGGDEDRGQMPSPRDRHLQTLLHFFLLLIGEFMILLWNLLQSHLTTKKSGGFRKIYNIFQLRWDYGECPPAMRDDRPLCSHATFSVKNQDILNDVPSYFKLARSVLKIASFEFANFQWFNSTFMILKIAWLVLNSKCKIVVFTQCLRQWLFFDSQNIVHLVAYIYILSNNEISKIKKTYL